LIEYYLCEVFHYNNSVPSSGWWCDGVIDLSVSEIEEKTFEIVGVAYWAKAGHASSPFYQAPFEIEFYFGKLQANAPQRVVIRFGCLDHFGKIRRVSISSVQRRPTQNKDWAFAIELTSTDQDCGNEGKS
jgi:hypothetical protein